MRAILICPDDRVRLALQQALDPRPDIVVLESLSEVPDTDGLRHLLRTWAPSVLFLDTRHLRSAQVNAQIQAEFPQIRRVGVDVSQEPSAFRRVMEWQMDDLVTYPITADDLNRTLDTVSKQVQVQQDSNRQTSRMLAFTPAKAGAGASTLAANMAWLSHQEPVGSVLLADFDLHSSVQAFLFGIEHAYSLADALSSHIHLDEETWRGLVNRVKGVDLLLSRPGQVATHEGPQQLRAMLEFARARYSQIYADLPDTWNPVALEVLRNADEILLVTTPELPSLRLAHLKARLLEKLELQSKARLVVNRAGGQDDLKPAQIEDMVGLKIVGSVRSDYVGVTSAIRDAKPAACLAEDLGELRRLCFNLATSKQQNRKFLGLFNVFNGRLADRGRLTLSA